MSLWCEGARAGRYVHLVAAKSAELVEVKVAQPTALCAPLQGFSASSDELKFANVRAWENCCSLCRRVPGAVAWVFVGACPSCSDPYAEPAFIDGTEGTCTCYGSGVAYAVADSTHVLGRLGPVAVLDLVERFDIEPFSDFSAK